MMFSRTISLGPAGPPGGGPERTGRIKARSGRRRRDSGGREHAFPGLVHGQGAPGAGPAPGPGGARAGAAVAGLRQSPAAAASKCEILAARAEDGARFVSFRVEAHGRGVIAIEIVERRGTAFLRATAENEALRAWMVERCDEIRVILQRCGLSLGGFDVSCGGGQGRAGGPAVKRVGQGLAGEARPEPHGPTPPQGELIG